MDNDTTAVPHVIDGREELADSEALAYLADHGYAIEAPALMENARKFPNSFEYTTDRQRYLVFVMPGGHWRTGDSTSAEERIRAAAGRRRW